MRILTLFRGALRHEYKMQIVKYLRAEEGELTRTDYREAWLAPGVREALEHEKELLCNIVLTNRDGTEALPLRRAMVAGHKLEQGILHLELVLGPFLHAPAGLSGQLEGWTEREAFCPPNRYVSLWQPAWPDAEEVDCAASLDVWRSAIDFVTTRWDFDSTAFLRLDTDGVKGEPGGPLLNVLQGEERVLTVVSYNPHLSTERLAAMRLTARNTGDIEVLSEPRVPVDRDGRMKLHLCAMDSGRVEVLLNVDPDHQFSTFFSLALAAAPAPFTRPSSVRRVVEREWRECVATILAMSDSLGERLKLLDRMDRALPNDPTVQLRRGALLLEMKRAEEAYECLSQALRADPSDADLVARTLFSALRCDRTREIGKLLPRLNLSRTDLFADLLMEVRQASDGAVTAILESAPTVLGDEKLQLLLQACTFAATSEATVSALFGQLRRFDRDVAVRFLAGKATGQPAWTRARVRLADAYAEDGATLALRGVGGEVLRHLVDVGDLQAFLDAYNRWGRTLPLEEQAELLVGASRAGFALAREGGEGMRDHGLHFAREAAILAETQNDLAGAREAVGLLVANGAGTEGIDPIVRRLEEIKERLSPEVELRSVADAVSRASRECASLFFLPEAHDSARECAFTSPGKVYEDLRKMDAIARDYQRDQLPDGWEAAFAARGVPLKADISKVARQMYPEEYTRFYKGEAIRLGPHVKFGGEYRIYFYIDRKDRVFVIGHIGKHLRGKQDS